MEYWMIVVICGSQVLSHLHCWHTNKVVTTLLRGKNRKLTPPPPQPQHQSNEEACVWLFSWRLVAPSCHCLGYLWDAVPVSSLWWLQLSTLGCSDWSLSTLKEILKHTAEGLKCFHPKHHKYRRLIDLQLIHNLFISHYISYPVIPHCTTGFS